MFDDVIRLIEEKQTFLITGHEMPDGDCVGSQAALYHLIRSIGKTVAIVNPDPVPPAFASLHRDTPFSAFDQERGLPAFEVQFLVDCHQLKRLGSLGEAVAQRVCDRVVINHHVGADRGDGDVALVDTSASATGVLVYDLYRKMGAPLSAPAARAVFVALATDTGWFRHGNTDGQTLAIAADLAARGVAPGALFDDLFRQQHPESWSLVAQALHAARLEAGGRIAIAALERNYMARADRVGYETEDILDPLRAVKGVEIAVLLKERTAGCVRLSLRSRGRFDVDGVARALGGGGHKKAAGARISGSLADAEAIVLDRLRRLIGA